MDERGAPDGGFDELALVPFEARHESGVIALLESVYAEYGQVLELETLDDDLPRIAERYREPNLFRVLLSGPRGAAGQQTGVGTVAGTVLGTVALKWHSAERAELKRVFLDRSLRGRRLGRRLVEWAVSRARAGGAEVLDIWTDVLFDDAHALYEKLGAEDTGELRALGGANEVRERHYVLRL